MKFFSLFVYLFLCLAPNGLLGQSNIVRIEYYIDTDPGFNNGTPLSFSSTTDVQTIISIDPTNLTDGVHRLNVRALNGDGNWSMTNALFLYKPFGITNPPSLPSPASDIVRIEYYIDADPGFNQGTPISFSSSTDIQNAIISIDPTSLSNGVHRLNVRSMNAAGNWSFTNSLFFYKPFGINNPPALPTPASDIVRIEYY